MLSREENDLITHTGPGTPMGNVMRRYWLPILLERELAEPDGEPVKVQILGERLVAFRDTYGKVGLIDEFCPHRRVSLWLGRNEECGLRCVYHGWKFDVDGNCVEQMNEPGENTFADKVRIAHYPTLEQGGIIWTYMGPAEKMPPPPCYEFTTAPATHRHVSKVIEECNWLQALEGGIDTSHAPILHRALRAASNRPGIDPRSPFVRGGAPKLEVDLTEYGYRYFGVRQMPEGGKYVRGYHYVMPFTQLRPASLFGTGLDAQGNDAGPGHFWVPMDDDTCMVWNFAYSRSEEGIDDEARRNMATATGQTTWTRRRSARSATRAITGASIAPCRRRTRTPESRASTRRIARSRRVWGRSSIAAANTSGPRTRQLSRCGGCCCRRCRPSSQAAKHRRPTPAITASAASSGSCRKSRTGATCCCR